MCLTDSHVPNKRYFKIIILTINEINAVVRSDAIHPKSLKQVLEIKYISHRLLKIVIIIKKKSGILGAFVFFSDVWWSFFVVCS